MLITINEKHVVGAPNYLKNRIVCNMHTLLNDMITIKQLLPPLLIYEYELLHFDDVETEFETRFRKLHLILIVIEYKSGIDVHISQNDVVDLYCKMKNETMYRLSRYVEEHFMCEMHKTLNNNISKSIDTLSLLCEGCSCINILEFDDMILKERFNLCIRHDLVYKFISNINFQEYHNVVETIDDGINDIKTKLMNTRNKFIVIMFGMTDIYSLISSLSKDIINELVYHLIHNINDKWVMREIIFWLPSNQKLFMF